MRGHHLTLALLVTLLALFYAPDDGEALTEQVITESGAAPGGKA